MGIKTWSVESLPNQGATNPELKTSWEYFEVHKN
jgi:hypothetical protein